MALNDGGANNSLKRKMTEIEQTPATNQLNLSNLRSEKLVAPPGVPSMFSQSSLTEVQRILNTAAPFKPFSYTAPLTAPGKEDHTLPLFIDLWNPSQQIDKIIASGNETLRNTLLGMVEKLAGERAAKKLKEKDMEMSESKREVEHYKKEAHRLEGKAEHYKNEASRFLLKAMALERRAESLRKSLEISNAVRMMSEEESESSIVNADNVGPVRLDCKVCKKEVAMVMMWPCRHVCVCSACDGVTKRCPVCNFPKTTSVEVCLPHNN